MKRADPEMRREYDFSGGVRGKFYRPRKVQKTLRLDADVVQYFQARAREELRGYQTLINEALRGAMRAGRPSHRTSDLRRIVAEEVRRALTARKKRRAAA